MNRFLSSKWFVAISTIVTFIVSCVFGYFMSFETHTYTWGIYVVSTTSVTGFSPKKMLAFFFLALVLTFIVFLICVRIRKSYLSDQQK